MGYTCPRCGFEFVDNMGGTLAEAMVAWREWIAESWEETDMHPLTTVHHQGERIFLIVNGQEYPLDDLKALELASALSAASLAAGKVRNARVLAEVERGLCAHVGAVVVP